MHIQIRSISLSQHNHSIGDSVVSMLYIGGLPSEFNYYTNNVRGLAFRPLTVADSLPISFIKDFRRPLDVVMLFQSVLNLNPQDIWQLTVDDSVYILSYLKSVCFTDAPVTVTWDCRNRVISTIGKRLDFHNDKEHMTDLELHLVNLERRSCDRKNSELIYPRQQNIIYDTPDFSFRLNSRLRVPRLIDLHIIHEAKDLPDWVKYSNMEKQLLWCQGSTIEDKLETLNGIGMDIFDMVAEAEKHLNHGLTVTFKLSCFDCSNTPSISNRLNIFDVLPAIDSTSIMNMQYTLMGKLGLQTGEDLPIQKLLFWHSAYLKDKQAKQAKQAAKNTKKK